MDYEKKYKEKLERAQKVLLDCTPEERKVVEYIFPNLAESEDEKIRKWLIRLINTAGYRELESDKMPCSRTNVIAWLEKLGGKKPADKVEPKFKVGDKIQYSKGCGTIMTIEKIENGEYIFGNNMGHITIESGNKWYLVNLEEQHTWSEEDDKTLNEIFSVAARASLRKSTLFGKSYDYIKWQKWLKSLKERVVPQPKQEWKQENTVNLTDFENAMMHIGNSFFGNNAGLDPNNTTIIKEQANILLELVSSKKWSEEDEEIYQSIMDDTVQENQLDDKQTNWLESLKDRIQPQPQWKPSIAQLNALSIVSKGNAPDDIEAIVSLYQDLKKLR